MRYSNGSLESLFYKETWNGEAGSLRFIPDAKTAKGMVDDISDLKRELMRASGAITTLMAIYLNPYNDDEDLTTRVQRDVANSLDDLYHMQESLTRLETELDLIAHGAYSGTKEPEEAES